MGESGKSDCLVYVSVLQAIRDTLNEESMEDLAIPLVLCHW